MSQELNYQIENVGGVERASLTLTPGVNCLLGRNGAGKTSAVRAIVRATGGSGELERRDGSERGSVDGPGVHLRVGKVVTATGEAELALADATPLSTLIDPGIKGTDAQARARVRALVELLGLRVDDASLALLCGGDRALAEWLAKHVQAESIDGLLDAAEALRNHVHALARDEEAEAERSHALALVSVERAEAAERELGGATNAIDLSVTDARAGLVAASRVYERAETQCEAREVLESTQAEIRETLGERPDASEALSALHAAQALTRAANDARQQLEQQLAAARAECEARQREDLAAKREAESVARRAASWDEAQAVLARTPEGPTRAELAGIRAANIGHAEAMLRKAEMSAQYREAIAEHDSAEERRRRAANEAERLRGVAAGLTAQLGRILADAGARGLTVVGGRLAALVDGKALDFERRLSDGQRVRAALDVAAERFGGQVVPLSGSYWTSLDPEAQQAFAALARERGLYVLTEQPANGALRVEHVGA